MLIISILSNNTFTPLGGTFLFYLNRNCLTSAYWMLGNSLVLIIAQFASETECRIDIFAVKLV